MKQTQQFYFFMTQKQSFSEEQLMNLLRNRKYKDFSQYIKQIENVNQDAEQAVINVLNNVLVKKIEKNPTIMLSGLMLYKMLLIGASFDFLTDDEYFPKEVHDEVAKICEYKPNIEAFTIRGSDYFVDLFKLTKTEQNKETLERSGNSYVLMALELVQCIATWYPNDYFNTKTKSIFRKKYEELLVKKIPFPPKEQLLIMKKVDEDNFKANYERFKDRMEEEESPKKSQKQPEVKPPPKKQEITAPPSLLKKEIKPEMTSKVIPPASNTLNIASQNIKQVQKDDEMIKIVGEIQSSVVAPKPPVIRKEPQKDQQNKKDPSMIALGQENVVETNKQPESSKISPTLSSYNSKNPAIKPTAKEPILPQEEIKSKVQKFQSSIGSLASQSLLIDKSNKPIKQQFKPQPVPPKTSQLTKKIQETNQSKFTEPQPAQVREQSKIPSAIQQSNIPNSQQQPAATSNIKKQEKVVPKQSKQSVILSESNVREVPKIPTIKQEPPRKMSEEKKIEQPMSFNPKIFANTVRINSNSNTPRKIPKTQKAAGLFSVQASPLRQDHNISFVDPKPNQSNQANSKPRSLPKTEKRNMTGINFYPAHQTKLQFQMYDQAPPSASKQFNKTLSYWANFRPKNQPSKQIQKSNSLNNILQEMKLDTKTLLFIPRYYEPLTISMHALRHESLTLYNSGISSNPFYSNSLIQCRLIKQSQHVFTLILQNISKEPLLVEYCEMKSIKYSNRIKILSWANRSDIGAYQISRKGFMDIKFKFQVGDLNFKFLTFYLRINEKVEPIVLPITLLDMCEFTTPINHNNLYRYELKGSIISSEPFLLGERGLPSFLGGFKFTPLSNSRTKKDHNLIVGECNVRLQSDDQGEIENEVQILIRMADWHEHLVELNILHITKSQYSEDLAKVILYLLMFLMKNQTNS